mgnify:CR=1 FL=1
MHTLLICPAISERNGSESKPLFILIFKRVNQEYPEKIDIPKEDEIGIMIYLNREITRLQQSKNPKIKNYVEERRTGAKKALYCVEHFDRTLTTLLVGNNIVQKVIKNNIEWKR